MRLKSLPKIKGVETYEYQLVKDSNVLGAIQIRKNLSHGKGIPEDFASNAYYEIYPKFRNKGYGNKILELGIKKAKKLGLKKLILTVLEDNHASIKIIENSGGVLLDKKEISNKKYMRKYSIEI